MEIGDVQHDINTNARCLDDNEQEADQVEAFASYKSCSVRGMYFGHGPDPMACCAQDPPLFV